MDYLAALVALVVFGSAWRAGLKHLGLKKRFVSETVSFFLGLLALTLVLTLYLSAKNHTIELLSFSGADPETLQKKE